ncbi:MAG: endonuclease III [Candidatus Zixiibacteriota bacterium]
MPRESHSDRSARARRIARALARRYPARCALTHDDPFQLLVATILSAQCTDERVNQVTPTLFARYRTVADFAHADPAAVEEIIRPTGFFRSKTRHIIAASRALVERHGGDVPRTLAELTALDGIGRKTANVVLGTAFGIAEGVVVDTHVMRLSRRLRLTAHRDPARIEADLMRLLPQSHWIEFSHRLIWHGRTLCPARRPRCDECPLAPDCPTARDHLT